MHVVQTGVHRDAVLPGAVEPLADGSGPFEVHILHIGYSLLPLMESLISFPGSNAFSFVNKATNKLLEMVTKHLKDGLLANWLQVAHPLIIIILSVPLKQQTHMCSEASMLNLGTRLWTCIRICPPTADRKSVV